MTILDRHRQAPGHVPQPSPPDASSRSEAYPIRRQRAPGREWLVAEGVKKTFKKRVVLKGVRVNLKRRESAGLLGPNGAGGVPASRPAATGAGRGAPGQ
jgi:lipopolysaccharide export system ATP-binding protein